MSGYTQAMLGVVGMMTGASADAAYEAAYGKFYTSFQQMRNAANQKVAAEANIAAITQNRINTDKVVAIQQDHAEAQAKVMAAVSGTEGQSLDATIAQTETNSSIAKQNNKLTAENQIEQQLAKIYSAQTTLNAVDSPKVGLPSLASSLAANLVPFAVDNRAAISDKLFGVEKTKPSGGILLPEG